MSDYQPTPDLTLAAHVIGRVLHRQFEDLPTDCFNCIPAEAIEGITTALMTVVAEVIQAWIDAGSERDVVMEDEKLRTAIQEQLAQWVTV